MTAIEFGDGNMNMVFKVSSEANSYIVKQAMPHGKINVKVYEPIERAKFDAMSLELQKKYVQEYIPKHYFFDEIMSANTYEDLGSMLTLRKTFEQGIIIKDVGMITGMYLARMFFILLVMA